MSEGNVSVQYIVWGHTQYITVMRRKNVSYTYIYTYDELSGSHTPRLGGPVFQQLDRSLDKPRWCQCRTIRSSRDAFHCRPFSARPLFQRLPWRYIEQGKSAQNGGWGKLLLFTGVRSKQDLVWCVKIGVCMGFNVYGGSWLLWLPVISIIVT